MRRGSAPCRVLLGPLQGRVFAQGDLRSVDVDRQAFAGPGREPGRMPALGRQPGQRRPSADVVGRRPGRSISTRMGRLARPGPVAARPATWTPRTLTLAQGKQPPPVHSQPTPRRRRAIRRPAAAQRPRPRPPPASGAPPRWSDQESGRNPCAPDLEQHPGPRGPASPPPAGPATLAVSARVNSRGPVAAYPRRQPLPR